MADIKSETIALAALFQCCTQIQRIATTGYFDERAVASVIRSLIVTDPKTIDDIYQESDLVVGFKQILDSFGKGDMSKAADTIVITKMALKLITLAHNVEGNDKVFNCMSDAIDALTRAIPTDHPDFLTFGNTQVVNTEEDFHLFGSLYQSIISPNFAKLIIYGEERCLREVSNQEKIRALLLAGIRAVILWRQVGGRRRFLVFRRKAILEYARAHV